MAIVQASGLLLSIKEEIPDQQTQITGNVLTATCTVTRHGRAEPVTKTFSVDDAKRAGLWQKPGPWSQYPKRMLAMRARAFALRDAFPDVLAGLYLKEEIEPASPGAPSDYGHDRQRYNVGISGKTGDEIDERAGREQNDAIPTERSIQDSDKITQNDVWEDNSENKSQSVPSSLFKEQYEGASRSSQPLKLRAPPPPVNPSRDTERDPPLVDSIEAIGSYRKEGYGDNFGDQVAHASLITLFDDALCCAYDPETLEEIREEFQPKIDALERTAIELAGRVFLRHEKRVADINLYPSYLPHHAHQSMQTKLCTGEDNTPSISQGHTTNSSQASLSSNRLPTSRRRPPRGSAISRTRSISLLALDARRRLSVCNQQANEYQQELDDHPEIKAAASVKNPTLPGADMCVTHHGQSQPSTSILLTSQHPDAPSVEPRTDGHAQPAAPFLDINTVHAAGQ